MKTLPQILSSITAATVILAAATADNAKAVTLAEYAMTCSDASSTNKDAEIKVATNHDALVIASDISGTVNFGKKGSGTEWELAASVTNSTNSSPDSTKAINDGEYISFSITPTSGQTISLSSLTFDASAATSSIRSFYVLCSIDGFTTSSILLSVTNDSSATGMDTTLAASANPYSISFSGSQYENISSTVEFRIYLQTATASQNIFFDNIVVSGSIATSQIPEPSTLALLAGLSILSLCFIARLIRR